MKKLFFLCEHPFTEHNSFKMELDKLKEKKIKIVIIDLSQIILGKNFSNHWKTEIEKKSLKFSSFISWFIYFIKLDKKNVIFWNNIKAFNLPSFFVELVLRVFRLKIITHLFLDIFSKTQKKSPKYIIERLMYHRLNIWPYFFFFKLKILRFILNLFPFEKIYLLSNNDKAEDKIDISFKKIDKIGFNSYDYSNYILFKNHKTNKRKFALYIDGGGPYFSGDRLLNRTKKDICDYDQYYGSLNSFFSKLEDLYSLEVLVIPHPKYKSKNNRSLNPYFNAKKVINDYDALPKLASGCSFFINYNSTALSFAISANKPVILFYSSKFYKEAPSIKLSRKLMANTLNKKAIDICNYNLRDIKNSLRIDQKKYDQYKYKFLTPVNKLVENTPNCEILEKLIQRI